MRSWRRINPRCNECAGRCSFADGKLSTSTSPPAGGVIKPMCGSDGTVTDAIVTRSSGFPALDEAASTWIVAHWRYRPATREGKPVTSQTNANVKFELVN